jgi:hypothetical protein
MKPLLLLFFLAPFVIFAQKHDYQWVMGYGNPNNNDTSGVFGGMFLNFEQLPFRVYKKNLSMNFGNFCSICSDSIGDLLYYSNGIRIYNDDHSLMENGDTINPGSLSIWNNFKDSGYPNPIGGFSIPKPGKYNQYYLFHSAASFVNNNLLITPLYYSLIDLSINNNLGKVLEKNIVLVESMDVDIIWPSFVKHANGRDWWLIAGVENTPKIIKFLITEVGIVGPLEQLTTLNFPIAEEGGSNCIFSPDGTWYLRCDANNGLNLFSFNRCTGELSNHQFLAKVPGYFVCSGSAIFSPDSKKLYVSDNRSTVIQFDLSDGILSYSRMDTVQQYDLFSDPSPPFLTRYFFGQLGADDKIYRATSGSTSYMHVTNRPNLPGAISDLENHGVKLPRYNSKTVCYFPNYRLGAWEGSPCDTIQLQNPPPGFVKTSYEAFLEREARGTPPKQVPPPDVLERLRLSPPTKPDNEDPFDPANPKHITLRALAEKGVITWEEALRQMRAE